MNRTVFFDAIRSNPFGGSLRQTQVDGIEAILTGWTTSGFTDLRWLAYMFGTAFHETATAMQAVIETQRADETKSPTVETAITRLENSWKAGKMPWVKTPYWRKDEHGQSWLGRGLVQCTHKSNYERAERSTGLPFTSNPELMLEIVPAVNVMIRGMAEGWFTTQSLAEYFDHDSEDWKNARQIINGNESDTKVAGYAQAFYAALQASGKPVAAPAPVPSPVEALSLEARVVALESYMIEVQALQERVVDLEASVKALQAVE